MKMLAALVVVAVAVSVADGGKLCRQWCKKFRLHGEQPAYCCDPGVIPQPPNADHPGFCPEIREVCKNPPRSGFDPPNVCAHDGFCEYHGKCCWDTCLDHHTCKPAKDPFH